MEPVRRRLDQVLGSISAAARPLSLTFRRIGYGRAAQHSRNEQAKWGDEGSQLVEEELETDDTDDLLLDQLADLASKLEARVDKMEREKEVQHARAHSTGERRPPWAMSLGSCLAQFQLEAYEGALRAMGIFPLDFIPLGFSSLGRHWY